MAGYACMNISGGSGGGALVRSFGWTDGRTEIPPLFYMTLSLFEFAAQRGQEQRRSVGAG